MKNKRLLPRLILGALLFLVAVCGCMAGVNLWHYLRMQTISAEVVRSSLLFDAPGKGNRLEITLRLDLKTADGSGQLIHWEEKNGPASYPEEGYDELRHWAPGTRHEIRQLRGGGREILLPGVTSPELGRFGIYVVLGIFVAFFRLAYAASESDKHSGVWLVFFSIGVGAFLGAGLYAWFQIPKRLYWQPAVATVEAAPAESAAEARPLVFPEGVEVTSAARNLLERSSYKVLRFNGLHAGLGRFGGRYEVLKPRCEFSDQECRFVINPKDRWDVELDAQWDQHFYLPLAVMGAFGLAFGGAGLLIRRFG